jgi:hypothetical protein
VSHSNTIDETRPLRSPFVSGASRFSCRPRERYPAIPRHGPPGLRALVRFLPLFRSMIAGRGTSLTAFYIVPRTEPCSIADDGNPSAVRLAMAAPVAPFVTEAQRNSRALARTIALLGRLWL